MVLMVVTLCHEYIMITIMTFFGQSNYLQHAKQFNSTFIVSQSPFSLDGTQGHSHVTPLQGFPQISTLRHISKGEQVKDLILIRLGHIPGADPGGAHPAHAPPKIGKNKIFWGKIVIFHTKYPKNVRASLRSAPFFYQVHPPNLKSWIHPCILFERIKITQFVWRKYMSFLLQHEYIYFLTSYETILNAILL